MRRLWLLLLICAFGAWFAWRDRSIERLPGVLAPEAPRQELLDGTAPAFRKDRYEIKALAAFVVEARVLGRENYRFDAGAELAPMDLALGWGPMSDSRVLAAIEISQSNRFYYWHADELPLPRGEIESHSANWHIVPASAAVNRVLRGVRVGEVVRIEGELVDVAGPDGGAARTSLRRDDTGAGACEIVLAQSLAPVGG